MARESLLELGAAYYPDYLMASASDEQGGCTMRSLELLRQKISADFARMRSCNLAVVRMGEFSWSSVEPEPGRFDFSLFQLALDEALNHQIKVIFCTPTATPPKWLVDAMPDVLPVLRSGHTIPFGSRRHYDFCHPGYREESKRITRAFADVLGKHPAIVGWQTDNEFGCHNSIFQFSSHCRRRFRSWLRSRYKEDIEALNRCWFTCFWSQGYRSFEEIELPTESWADQNPHMELDFRRFSNDMVVEFHCEQVEILRVISPGRFITHNLMTAFTDLCPWKLAEHLDVVGFDHYQMETHPSPVTSGWQFSLMRSLRPDSRFLVLEQQPVQVNWQKVNRRLSRDWLLLWGAQSAVLGASGMYYFSWQRMYGGAEQYHDGIVPHDVRVSCSGQEKVLRAKAQMFDRLAGLFGVSNFPEVRKDVLCLYNSESLWSHEITSQSVEYDTKRQVDAVARLCFHSGLGLHFAESIDKAKARLAEFRCLIIPGYAFEFSAEEKAILFRFMESGGRVVSFPRTAMKRRDNQMSRTPFSIFDDDSLCFDDFGAMASDERETVLLTGKAKKTLTAITWAERLEVNAKLWNVLGWFSRGLYAHSPAIIRRKRGNGAWIHFAFCPEFSANYRDFIVSQLDLSLEVQPPESKCQLVPLKCGAQEWLVAVNFATNSVGIGSDSKLSGTGFSLSKDLELRQFKLKGEAKGRKVTVNVPARSVCLFKLERPTRFELATSTLGRLHSTN